MKSIIRQLWMLLCCLLYLAAPASATTRKDWNFKVMLNGDEIGQHHFEVVEQDHTRHVKIDANFDVRILFFNAYSYQHRNYEVWRGECLQSIQSHTDDNGDKEYVRGKTYNGILKLQTSGGVKTFDGCVRTFAYWDPAILNSQALLNAQTGELMPVRIQQLGETIIEAHGKPVKANHYRIDTGKFSVDLWYTLQKQWLALQSTTANGSVLRYQLQ